MIDSRAFALVGLGAAAGGMARYAVGIWAVARWGPAQAWIGTGIINVTGSFLIGIVLELAARDGGLPPAWRLLLATGLLGGYTTFSSFAWETLTLLGGQARLLGLAYALGSLILGIAAAFAGSTVVRLAVR